MNYSSDLKVGQRRVYYHSMLDAAIVVEIIKVSARRVTFMEVEDVVGIGVRTMTRRQAEERLAQIA